MQLNPTSQINFVQNQRWKTDLRDGIQQHLRIYCIDSSESHINQKMRRQTEEFELGGTERFNLCAKNENGRVMLMELGCIRE